VTMQRQSSTGDVDLDSFPIGVRREVFLCPNCHGQKTVQRPPSVAGDQAVWLNTGTPVYPCPTCDAKGYIVVRGE